MIPRVLALLLLVAAASPSPRYFRYDRPILSALPQKRQTCITLDPSTLANSGPQLSSLRLYNGEIETPYAVNYSRAIESSAKSITPLNTGLRNGVTSFDAAMPEAPYNNLDLDISGRDFIATVRVSGSQTQTGPTTSLGAYTIFDFTRQKLGRSTILHLPQSDFRYLHFRIDGPIRPEQITGLNTGRLPISQPQYVAVATTSSVLQKGRDSVIEFSVPANVPVERIVFAPGAQPVNFSREVTVTIAPATVRPPTDTGEPLPPSVASGNLLRIHSTLNGHKIDEEHLSLEAPGLPSAVATKWTILIHNEDDPPIALQSVSLQMIARTLCFDAEPNASYKLFYGDDALAPPHYDYASLFTLDKQAAQASLGPEQLNPQHQNRPDTRPFTEKHPALLWTALIAAVFILGVIALRSGRQLKQP